jgi:hypothetical protein
MGAGGGDGVVGGSAEVGGAGRGVGGVTAASAGGAEVGADDGGLIWVVSLVGAGGSWIAGTEAVPSDGVHHAMAAAAAAMTATTAMSALRAMPGYFRTKVKWR